MPGREMLFYGSLQSMKQLWSALAGVLLLSVAACNQTDTTSDKCAPVTQTAPLSEVTTLRTYISSNSITAVEDSRGFFYTIQRPGNSVRPSVCSNVTVSYTGRLTTGNQFDASNGVSFNLSNLILGWQEGIPLIGEGGSIILYLPPSLAYGSQASGNIPANSILIFQIELIDVQS